MPEHTSPLPPAFAEQAWAVAAHRRSAADLAADLRVQLDAGLGAEEAGARLARHGRKALPEPAPRAMWLRMLDQFHDFMILVLLAAAVRSEERRWERV